VAERISADEAAARVRLEDSLGIAAYSLSLRRSCRSVQGCPYTPVAMPTVVTIGVYGFTREGFLEALRGADVRALIDVRQRRGLRGSEYSWANSNRLQAVLAEAGVEYRHRKDLATTTEIRRLQYEEDAKRGVGQRSRVELAPAVRRRYEDEVLGEVDLAPLVDGLVGEGVTALMCVERDPAACHRSIIGEHLADEHGVTVRHLLPPAGSMPRGERGDTPAGLETGEDGADDRGA
jgi:uncharacterized protein (DUF488 family)